MRISDWSSDVCSSDLQVANRIGLAQARRDLDRTGQRHDLGVDALLAQPAAQQRRVAGGYAQACQLRRAFPRPLLGYRDIQAAAAEAERAPHPVLAWRRLGERKRVL